ncbi:MAG: penicillin acylase family protein [Caulobacter sp.]
MHPKFLCLLGAAAAIAMAAPAYAGSGAGTDRVEVRYTAYGVAHVVADTYEGAGFGYGGALARDNLCVVVERSITIAGERSRSMPADARYYDSQSFGEISNLDSDGVYRFVVSEDLVSRVKKAASPEIHDLVRGYTRGFNRHVSGPALAGEDCRKQAWFRPLTEDDVWRRIAHTPLLETTARVLRDVVAATPPKDQLVAALSSAPGEVVDMEDRRGASNAVAFGRDGVEGGVGGMSFANPHYVWHGPERLHAMHLTVRGKLNVFGATLYGLPFPILGFTDSVGWGITHTTDKRSTIYRVELDPKDPTRYSVGGRMERMRPVNIRVETLDGPVTRTFWQTRYGPVMQSAALPWDGKFAYTLADPEIGNVRFADQFLAIARARNVREVRDALKRIQGAPWSNVTAADRDGEVFYSNITVAANITDAQLARCVITGPAHTYMERADFTTLNGSDPTCAWTREAGTPQPGIIPAARRPSTLRSDVVFNSNDSHWFSTLDPTGLIEGIQTVVGPERTPRAERTRVAALYSREIMLGGAITGSPGATPDKWERLFFSARNLTAELVVDDLAADCTARPKVSMPDGSTVDVAEACRTISAWDRRDMATSRGSALFGEFIRNLGPLTSTPEGAARVWRNPFNPTNPVATPSGLVMSEDVRQAFALAVVRFRDAGLPLDGALADQQSVTRNGVRLPISGSSYTYHRIATTGLTTGKGFAEIRAGDSYIHVVSLRPDGVNGRFIVTYSQSTNPSSPHFSDMTSLFSERRFADVTFSEESIRKGQVGEALIYDLPISPGNK